MTETTARILRIFLASPGDVPEERAQARHLIKDDLPALPFIRDKAWLKIIAWEDPTSRAPMPATLSPQKAIELGMDRPSICDIVVVVFWSRMGTPLDVERHGLKDDERPYWSGTEWEYTDALKASEATGKPVVLVYRRTAGVSLNPEMHDFEERVEQLRRVKEFFAAFRDPATGAFLRGYTEYETPEQFGEMLKHDLLHYIERMLKEDLPAPPPGKTEIVPEKPQWDGSPFPGLRAFTPEDAPIFFGRSRETDALIKRVSERRFVAVVGASGSGKSSLVGAGLIPRLLDNAIPGSKDWLWRRFTPGEVSDNPFAALAVQLAPLVDMTPRDLAEQLSADPHALCIMCEQALAGQPDWAELLLFIDQFEELFTVVRPEYRAPFVALLDCAATTDRLRTVVTMRADFYHRCVEYPRLAELLRDGSFPLAAPEIDALLEMIERPAVLAGLEFDTGLPGRMLRDTGQEPGALALLAYTLDELYKLAEKRGDGCLTFADYQALGGVQGAIGTRAENVFARLDTNVQATLPHVFRELVEVDERGTATRQRAPVARFEGNPAALTLLRKFTDARLLMTSGNGTEAIVEVAHEALFRHWERLAEWIETAQDDLRLLRQVRGAAAEWDATRRDKAFLWPDERLKPVYAMVERLEPDLNAVTQEFIVPETERMLAELEDINTLHHRRAAIGERLAVIGDPRPGVGLRPDGLPDIVWCAVPGGEVEIEGQTFTVEPFYIAQYPVTYVQFQAFADDPEGFRSDAWSEGLTEEYRKQKVGDQTYKFPNQLRDKVSWYQAVAFSRWLNAKLPLDAWPDEARHAQPTPEPGRLGRLLGGQPNAATWQIRLPTEWEWLQAATGGNPNVYPWGLDWDPRRANTSEAGLGRGAAAGLYPAGAAACGALDMSGGLWWWCLNEYNNPANTGLSGGERRALRGGYYGSNAKNALGGSRGNYYPYNGSSLCGLRVCASCAFPIK